MLNFLLIYLLLINFLGFVLYGIDKAKSKRKGSSRIPERTLLWVARLGGGLGCWLGMMLFRHKTKHTRFMVLVPLWTVVWIVGVVLLMRYC
ncbi:MAG: DUF1294 domain-containing protein [Bacteroidales bacterium]|nr:DUF1294 domain-containing protein [Bacteroidales bacterium]